MKFLSYDTMVKEVMRAKKRTTHAYAEEQARHMRDVSADRITIRCAKKHTIAYPLLFEVGVQVELGHRQLARSMTMLPGQIVPIHLLDSSGLQRTIPIQFQEETSDQTEMWPEG